MNIQNAKYGSQMWGCCPYIYNDMAADGRDFHNSCFSGGSSGTCSSPIVCQNRGHFYLINSYQYGDCNGKAKSVSLRHIYIKKNPPCIGGMELVSLS